MCLVMDLLINGRGSLIPVKRRHVRRSVCVSVFFVKDTCVSSIVYQL